MNNGWIKLHRTLKENPIYSNSTAIHCWIECLLRANHSKTIVFLKRQKLELEPGQFPMGRDEFGKSINISGSTAWYWLLQFEADNMIDIKKTAKGSVVSIKNWSDYQGVDSTSDNKKTTNEQHLNTLNNDKNEKNEKNIYASLKCLNDELCISVAKQYSVGDKSVMKVRDNLVGWCEAKGKKYKNYKSALQNWVRTEIDRGNIKKVETLSVPKLPEVSKEESERVRKMMEDFKVNRFTTKKPD